MQVQVKEDVLLPHPTDGVSNLQFSGDSNQLLISLWDGSVYAQNVQGGSIAKKYSHEGPALNCCYGVDNHTAFSSGVDGSVRLHNFPEDKHTTLGKHDGGVKCLKFLTSRGMLISGSWDKRVKVWDPRADTPCVETVDQPDKVFCIGACAEKVVVGTAGRHVYVYDVRKLGEAWEKRQSTLKYQTRCIECFPNCKGYALTSIEGRVSMEYFDSSPEVQSKKYAFKCHRSTQDKVETAYPVNCIAFHPLYGTFATGGCDGFVNVWDGENKKRLCQFHKYETSIAAMDFSHNGSLLAIASSYTYESGVRDHPQDKILVREIVDSDVKPKPRT